MADQDPFLVRGKTFYTSAFYNCVLATNIAVYKYMADSLFDGDMDRVVWASIDKMFKRRQEQLMKRKVKSGEGVLGILDFPFCAFRLSQDFLLRAGASKIAEQGCNVHGGILHCTLMECGKKNWGGAYP